MRSLRTPSAVVIERATEAPKTKPRLRNVGVLALIVGMLLGIGIALAWEAMEKRPRSIDEVERRLGLRVLGRIPATPEGASDLVTMSHPTRSMPRRIASSACTSSTLPRTSAAE